MKRTRHLVNIGGALCFLTSIGIMPALAAPILAPTPTLTTVIINASPGDQYDPHVSGDWVSYTSGDSIRYYNFATRTDAAVPMGISPLDLLSDVSGSRIVFSRIIPAVRTAVMMFDAATPAIAPVEINQAAGSHRIDPAIGANTVAYLDYGLHINGELVIHDLAASSTTRITNDTAFDNNPSVSPDGNVVNWEHCVSSSDDCDIWQAVRSGPGWNIGVTAGSPDPEFNPDSNGALVVYDAFRGGNSDIFFRFTTGGPEGQLQLAAFEANPSIALNFILLESRPDLLSTSDLYLYDLFTNLLYRITNTPLVTEQLNDITVLADGSVRLVWTTDENGVGERNVRGATFSLAPSLVAEPSTLLVMGAGLGMLVGFGRKRRSRDTRALQ